MCLLVFIFFIIVVVVVDDGDATSVYVFVVAISIIHIQVHCWFQHFIGIVSHLARLQSITERSAICPSHLCACVCLYAHETTHVARTLFYTQKKTPLNPQSLHNAITH